MCHLHFSAKATWLCWQGYDVCDGLTSLHGQGYHDKNSEGLAVQWVVPLLCSRCVARAGCAIMPKDSCACSWLRLSVSTCSGHFHAYHALPDFLGPSAGGSAEVLTMQVAGGRVGEQGMKRSPRAAAEARQPACWSALLESHGGVLSRRLSLKKCWRTPNVETEMKPNPMSLDLKISALCVCSSVRHLGGYRVIYRVIFWNNFAMQTVNIAEYLMLFLDQTS